MSPFDNFITEGNEKAEEPANEGSMMNGGEMAQVRASTVQQTSEEVEAKVHCLVEDWRDWAEPHMCLALSCVCCRTPLRAMLLCLALLAREGPRHFWLGFEL